MKPRGILKKARRRRIPDSIIRGRRTESGTLCRIVKRLCPDDLHPVLAASLVSPPGYVQLITARFLSPRNPPTPREIRTPAQPGPARPGWATVDPEIKCSPHSSTLCAALWEQIMRRFAMLANFWKKSYLSDVTRERRFRRIVRWPFCLRRFALVAVAASRAIE